MVANSAEMRSLSSKNQDIKYSLCVIDVFNKYSWLKPLRNKKAETVLHDFVK